MAPLKGKLEFTVELIHLNLELIIPRKIENISGGPTFGDYVTILTEGTIQSLDNP
jgi:hypothetical protein